MNYEDTENQISDVNEDTDSVILADDSGLHVY